MKVIQATKEHIQEVALMFDMFRQFYGKKSDKFTAEKFITDRLTNNDSLIFVALDEVQKTVVFSQVYFSFSSISANRILILNDLFVKEEARGKGIGRMLISHVFEYAKSIKSTKVTLSTKEDNFNAQILYNKMGFIRDEIFYHYYFPII